MDRHEKKLKEGSEQGSENGSNEETDNEDKVSTMNKSFEFIHLF